MFDVRNLELESPHSKPQLPLLATQIFAWLLIIYSFQSRSALQPLSVISSVAEHLFFSRECEL